MSERELRQYYWIQREIERLYEEIQELGFQTLMIPLNDGIPSPSYQPKDGVGALAVAMVALQEQSAFSNSYSFLISRKARPTRNRSGAILLC